MIKGCVPLVLAALVLTGCPADSKKEPVSKNPQVVVLGFDGVDPDQIEAMWSQGKLPNLKKLADQGSFSRLGTTQPPQSPVAWASFATGTLPGNHGVFDFIGREPQTYLPRMGALEYRSPRFDASGQLVEGISGQNRRNGKAFWQVLSEQGVEVEVLNVPYSWPPEPVPLGGVASGLGVPDLRPTNSTSTVFSTDFREERPKAGGVRAVPLRWDGQPEEVALEGPKGSNKQRSKVVLGLGLVEAESGLQLELRLPEKTLLLGQGDWSDWESIRFPLGSRDQAAGQVRFHLEALSKERLHLYASAIGADPDDPFCSLSHPPSLAQELERRAGAYNTVGWEEDTSALNAELISEEAFLTDLLRTMEQREAMTLGALDDSPPDLLISVWTGTDRASHMFWRLTDPESPRYDEELAASFSGAIETTYERMDAIVGAVRARMDESALLMVLSDHGFHPFHRGVHVNRWLIDHGFLTLKPGGRSLADADWEKTRAYALGTGQIYLNLQGREGQGVVAFGPERQSLLEELKTGLLQLRDGSVAPLAAVTSGTELYSGERVSTAPDLVLSFASGYQTSWATRLGGAPEGLFEENQKKWSGGHASSLASETHGVLFTSRGEVKPGARIDGFGPSLLQVFGKEIPQKMDGVPFL